MNLNRIYRIFNKIWKDQIIVPTNWNHWFEIWIVLFQIDESSIAVIMAIYGTIGSTVFWSLIIPIFLKQNNSQITENSIYVFTIWRISLFYQGSQTLIVQVALSKSAKPYMPWVQREGSMSSTSKAPYPGLCGQENSINLTYFEFRNIKKGLLLFHKLIWNEGFSYL